MATRTSSQIGRGSRRKGNAFQSEVVKRAIAVGLPADNTGRMQQGGATGSYGDVTIAGLKVECKSHARISGWIQLVTAAMLGREVNLTKEQQGWLDGHDALILKQTGWPEPLVVKAGRTGLIALPLAIYLQTLMLTGRGNVK